MLTPRLLWDFGTNWHPEQLASSKAIDSASRMLGYPVLVCGGTGIIDWFSVGLFGVGFFIVD
jgi:hypothetical protein